MKSRGKRTNFDKEKRRFIYQRKLRILRRDKCICYLCGCLILDEVSATVDHVIPLALGGRDDESNMRSAHLFCNRAKQDMSVEEFRQIAAIWASQI